MLQMNRPFGAVDVSANLKGAVAKAAAQKILVALAERVERVQDAHKVPGEEFRQLKFGLVEVVYEWAKGMVSRARVFPRGTELTVAPFTAV